MNKKRFTGKQKGSIYFLVLASALVLVLSVIGISYTIMHSRKVSESIESIDQTEVYAELGIRHAISFTNQAGNWRTVLNSGPWLTGGKMGDATYELAGIDTFDSNLANNETDRVTLACTVTIDDITRTRSLQARQEAMDFLSYAIAAGSVRLNNNARISGDVYSVNTLQLTNSSCVINGNVLINQGYSNFGIISGAINSSSDLMQLEPLPQNNFVTYYESLATPLPSDLENISNRTFSSTSNPYGTPNPLGIYLINAANEDVTFNNCTINGTIIVNNIGSGSNLFRIDGTTRITAPANQPALILQGGNVRLESHSAGLPINGLVYMNVANAEIEENQVINGTVVVTGNLVVEENAQINYNSMLKSSPPLKFRNHYLSPIANTWN